MSKPSQPYLIDLQFRGYAEGLTYLDNHSKPLCHYFGGVPYALPPVGAFRFQKPRSLPPCYRYGTRADPARFTGRCGVCPQLGASESGWDEDCLQSNVWVPVGEAPDGGWPVLFYIHGGFLQVGSPNDLDLRSFLAFSPCKCIVVAPAYRLNIFGFLASSSLSTCSDFSTNAGFWDQRLALEWTHENISYFGGNAANITLSGYSAGSHSVFHQLAYDLGVPERKAIVKRAMMLSNGPGPQPKPLHEAQDQYLELLSALDMPATLAPSLHLQQLRALDPLSLLRASQTLTLHQFRATTDTTFVRPNLLAELKSGLFASRLKSRSTHLLLGECSNEHFVYANWHPPSPGYMHMSHRLGADYSQPVTRVLMRHFFPRHTLPRRFSSWKNAFGHVYAHVQIHALLRGMVADLAAANAHHLIHRYRIEFRLACVDAMYPTEWGATHASDLPIWFWGNGAELREAEVRVLTAWHQRLGAFVRGDEGGWGSTGAAEVGTLKGDGSVVVEGDEGMGEALELWEEVKRAGEKGAKL